MAEQATNRPTIDPLFGAIVTQMFKDSAATTNALLDSYKHQADRAEATLWLVREQIGTLLEGPYMPTSHALAAALWPSDNAIAVAIDAGKEH